MVEGEEFWLKWWLDLSGQGPTREKNQDMVAEAPSTQCHLWPPPAPGEEPGASRDRGCWCSVPCQDRLAPAPQCKVPSPFSGSLMLSVSLLSLSNELIKYKSQNPQKLQDQQDAFFYNLHIEAFLVTFSSTREIEGEFCGHGFPWHPKQT